MSTADIVIIVIVAVVFAFALRKVIKNLKSGKCCSCSGSDDCTCCDKKGH